MPHTLNNRFDPKPEINLGIIGPEDLIQKIKPVLKTFPSFQPYFYVATTYDLALETASNLKNSVDALMFLESHFYQAARNQLNLNIPIHHIPLASTGLYRSLFLINSKYKTKNISIDTISLDYVKQVLNELNENKYSIFAEDHSSITPFDEVIDFHIKTFRKHHSVALTGMSEIALRLKQLGIPYERVIPTNQDMIVALERALLATETRRNKESQIVLGLINLDEFRKVTEKYDSEHDVQLLKLKIQQMLLDYIKQIDGHLINLGSEYLFITTRGTFERETRGYKYIPLLYDAKKHIGVSLSIGVGFGQSASEAGNHARLALSQSKDTGGNVCYIVREDRSVIGPVEVTSESHYEQYNLSITDSSLLERAEKAGMSATYMTKLMARVSRHQKIDYTAQELATTLNITIRSAHRILLKWLDAELVRIIGEEKHTHKGRPRRIYRLNFVDEEVVQ
ncbi:hypothetical protein [Aquisalibacillus elongatus]|uniref:GGDEF domain-containing protein n=1 Tax=Aquisalibacillus elongatus TaxID=485577 RepID=A0A3N5BA67_9BACI|nr:hypothetical protein [Aquisalibacillus elongatus]RPF54277.1 hypothetical protein EDC24_1474 [Aquisalibacillus elongatus]